uniref:Uncharacterized protein n=1 Tax=Panagrolaimus sp. ES5 TaxID=591445 RepID=A0AC34GFW6_9BILA
MEGMNAYEIVRDFVQLSDEATRNLFYEYMIRKKIRNKTFWTNVLTNETEWATVFGIDNAFRIPCEDKK